VPGLDAVEFVDVSRETALCRGASRNAPGRPTGPAPPVVRTCRFTWNIRGAGRGFGAHSARRLRL